MFAKDSRSETFLTQMGVSFVYTNSVFMSQLKAGWKTTNLARPVPIREEAVIEYATLMDSGSPAPAPILHEVDGGYEILDGMQRVSAAELLGITRLPAYIVDCDSEDVIAAIRVLANLRLQGHSETPEWSRRRAVEVLVVERGLSVQEVAKMGGWNVQDIERIAKGIGWQAKITAIGGPTLPDNMLATLSGFAKQTALTQAPVPISSFLNAVRKSQLSNEDATPYFEDFFRPVAKTKKSHLIYAERLQQFLDDPDIVARLKGRKRSELRVDVKLRKHLRSALTVLESMETGTDRLDNVDEFFKLTNDITERLKLLNGKKRR